MKQINQTQFLQKILSFLFRRSLEGYLCFLLIIITFSACTDADRFYQKLDRQPEILNNYNSVYIVGDTLTIQGRLNPENNLEIRIGGVKAEILSVTVIDISENSPYTIESAKVLITEEMGIGEDRPVSVTSAGIIISTQSIEIVGNGDIGILPHQLQLQKVVNIPSGSTPIYCRSGNGHVYLMNNKTYAVSRVTPDGNIEQVFSLSACKDADGTPFDVTQVNAMGVDPKEQYLYMSLYTKAPWATYWSYYRFCRWNMQNNSFEVLNKTPYHIYRSQRTPEAAQPFEGRVAEAKIYKITAIYPDSEGNIYCSLMGHFLTKLNTDGNYSYLFNFTQNQSAKPTTEDAFVPLINNPETGEYYSTVWIHQFFPGNKINYGINYMDLKTQKAYTRVNNGSSLRVTDMTTLIQTGEYTQNYLDMYAGDVPYVTASLKNFNGAFVSSHTADPLPVDGKLVGLYFMEQATVESALLKNFYKAYELPALCEINLGNHTVRRYAPRKLVMNGYNMTKVVDQFLNIDEDGMLYLTANTQQVIVKTTTYNNENE